MAMCGRTDPKEDEVIEYSDSNRLTKSEKRVPVPRQRKHLYPHYQPMQYGPLSLHKIIHCDSSVEPGMDDVPYRRCQI